MLRNMKRFVGAKTNWSVRTRAAMVRFGRPAMVMERERKRNQIVAAGPNIAVRGRGDKLVR